MGAETGVMQPQELVEKYEHVPSEPSGKPILPTTGLPASGLQDNKFLLFQATWSEVICYDSPRKLIQ